jgi:hypothetical protein
MQRPVAAKMSPPWMGEKKQEYAKLLFARCSRMLLMWENNVSHYAAEVNTLT